MVNIAIRAYVVTNQKVNKKTKTPTYFLFPVQFLLKISKILTRINTNKIGLLYLRLTVIFQLHFLNLSLKSDGK